ncbi:DUF1028 domain-containing protein [Clostridium sp. CF012]|uniref:DUF1028 domain-containing protein n=1 Tax=Clostridium sp. CF012 TaxID=2843319 RepID=UPI001C0E78E4|nr:DUF1028 domain-containing protein [Clostridium sp. CF012]MBU3143803.1 DUF1028 domain-containing protein [Clostridium sp. CF012]
MGKIDYTEFTNTYSIVAFDPIKHQLGIAMQTHNFAACNRVIYAEPGVGVVASQSYTNPSYGFEGIKMMREGNLPEQILKDLIEQDVDSEYRQIGIIDANGNVSAHTGSNCIREAGHRIGKHYSCQANMMLKDTVWDAMGSAFESCDGELADCIMNAMEAAESEGGDIRGAQSAAITIVTSDPIDKPWLGYIYDFKVYDNPKPLKELRRLINLKKANNCIDSSHIILHESSLDSTKISSSIKQFTLAVNKIPNEDSRVQQQFYYALSLLKCGLKDESISLLKSVFTAEPIWKEVASRIAKAESNECLSEIIDNL